MTLLRAALAKTRPHVEPEVYKCPDNTPGDIRNIKSETVSDFVSQHARFQMVDDTLQFEYHFRIE